MALRRAQRPASAPSPLLDGLGLVEGSGRLIGLRLAVWLLASAPLVAAALAGAEALAHGPYFTDVAGRLPAAQLLRLRDALGAGPLVGLGLAALLALVAEQVLVAGALSWLDPGRDARPGSVTRLVGDEGPRWLLVFVRVVLMAAALIGLGAALIQSSFHALHLHGDAAGWSGRALILTLPALELGLVLLWAALVGAFAFWCRLVSVADGRRRLRRTALVVLAVWRRHPLRSAALYVVANLTLTGLGGLLLLLWRQHPPRGLGLGLVVVAWLALLGLRCYVWHWLIRAGRLLYAGDDLAGPRATADAPLHPLRWIRLTLRLYSRRVG